METPLVCPNCKAENMAGALTCYRCNTRLPAAPNWVGPASFKVYDPAKDRGIAYIFAALGGLVVAASYFLSWLGTPREAVDAANRGTGAIDILLGATGSRSAIGSGGVGEASVGLDVRLALLAALLAALAAVGIAIARPLFGPLLACGLVVLAGTLYFGLQLVARNTAQFNAPDLVALLRWGFYGALLGGALIVAASLRYRRVPMMQSRER